MCFSSKVLAQNMFLQNGGKHNAPIFANKQTTKDVGIDQDLS